MMIATLWAVVLATVDAAQCSSSNDCAGMCNMDFGSSGGFCEPCRAKSYQDCIDEGFQSSLGTDECIKVCLGSESEYFNPKF